MIKIPRLLIRSGILSLAFTTSVLAQAQKEIKVGVSLALSGVGAPMSLDVKDGLLFSNSHYFQNKYKLIFEDDQCDNAQAITVAQKLINLDKVKYALGFLCNTTLLATAPIYRRAGTLVITAGASSGDQKGIGDKILAHRGIEWVKCGVIRT
jgi:branched-chain amino acid transport system substrate-binding protein